MKKRKLKRLLLACVGLTALATMAEAADIPPPMPMPKAPVFVPFFSWTGFYLGINGGYGFGDSRWTETVTGSSTGNFNVDGFVIGGTPGFNFQSGAWGFGLEGDIDWSDIKGSTTANCPLGCETKNTWLGTGRGRLGYAFDRFLPYITGGAAFGDVQANATGFSGTKKTQFGWTIGGGIEYAFI